MATAKDYKAQINVDGVQIREWVDTFHRLGYLFLEEVLPLDWCEELRHDLDRAIENEEEEPTGDIQLVHRMFEQSHANLKLFDMEPIVTFAETIISSECHVIHNNSFLTHPGGGISGWHQDDPPHYVVTEGEPPKNVHLPVLFFTANYYLTDVTESDHDGTEVIPGSHLFGKAPPSRDLSGTGWEAMAEPNFGKAGSLVMFNNQVWHQGGPNTSDRVRYITQISYARRIIGHKYAPFMNYTMPEHVYRDADPRLRQLLGFLPHGAYG